MVKNIVFFVLLFYLFALLQTTFLVNFNLWGYVPNLILITVILLNIFKSNIKLGTTTALIGGFFLDVFSNDLFGFWILISLIIAILIQYILKRYVRLPKIEKIGI